MPSAKRSHGRITSGNARPHKSARFGDETGNVTGIVADDDSDSDMSVDGQPFTSTVPTYQSFYEKHAPQDSSMRVKQMVAWPTSLGAIRTHFYYNLTPQEGYELPEQVLKAVSNRIIQPGYRSSTNRLAYLPYINLGFISFLNIQIFVFLPNLRLNIPHDQRGNRIHESILEKWTDNVILPSIARQDPRAPSSWRLANLYKHSPAWYDDEIAPFPVYKVFNSQDGHFLSKAWQSIQDLSMKTLEFQHPFLLLYSDGQSPHLFCGDGPEETMRDFERSWLEQIDMTYVPMPEDNFRVDFDYGNPLEIRHLAMR